MRDILKQCIYFGRNLAVVQMDLRSLPCDAAHDSANDIRVVNVISAADISKVLIEPKSRFIKALQRTKRGYGGFIFMRGTSWIGDIWYAACGNQAGYHNDLKWLQIRPTQGSVYLFDMYLQPQARGGMGIAAQLLKASLCRLRDAGFQTAYGFYWHDNLSALWMHRMLRYKELDRRKAYAFFSLRYSVAIKDEHRKNGVGFCGF